MAFSQVWNANSTSTQEPDSKRKSSLLEQATNQQDAKRKPVTYLGNSLQENDLVCCDIFHERNVPCIVTGVDGDKVLSKQPADLPLHTSYSVAKDRNPRYVVIYAFSITYVFCSNLLICT
tara:strand:+ start:230 stop:589 length:360 start_codon:yes stop_codon:yes gene_type:complete